MTVFDQGALLGDEFDGTETAEGADISSGLEAEVMSFSNDFSAVSVPFEVATTDLIRVVPLTLASIGAVRSLISSTDVVAEKTLTRISWVSLALVSPTILTASSTVPSTCFSSATGRGSGLRGDSVLAGVFCDTGKKLDFTFVLGVAPFVPLAPPFSPLVAAPFEFCSKKARKDETYD